MTTTIRAQVKRFQPGKWAARAFQLIAPNPPLIPHRISRTEYRESWAEAMQAAQVLRAELDRELMAEVYASSSRVQRCGACRDLSVMHTYAGDCRHRVETPGAETTTKRRQPVVIGPEQEPTT